MQISFESRTLKNRCLVLQDAEVAYGRPNADRLTSMIADAEAFENVGLWHEFLGEDLVSKETMSFKVSFSSVYRATFVAIDRYREVDATGQVDWFTVEYVKLTEISGQQ
ncbi:hypothetical protein KXJ81_10370 [Ensifer adhaerens]|uniref:hypothetical protein n=1 Tax=Ensifer adhaerens TaxID=106592 RepID=UPI001C4DDD5E|nr:hypothetical protein [Ensifer adhaerens]MBW0366652.1 hypothetical protein [Ensifer adhaerens]